MKNIACLLTPFHALQLINLRKLLALEEISMTIFYSSCIASGELKNNFPGASFKRLPEEINSVKNVLKNPTFEILRLRRLFKRYLNLISTELDKSETPFNLIVFSDKDLFCQLLINKAHQKKNKHQIIAIEEGIGYYRLPRWYNKLLNQTYLLVSNILLAQSIRYIPILGTHPYIDKAYVRFLDFATQERANIQYVEIPSSTEKIKIDSKAGKVLILTAPLSEDKYMSLEKEKILLSSVFNFFASINKPVDLKQHPRENAEKNKEFLPPNFNVIPKNKSAETILLSNYKYIINFGSSVILDLYLKGFPMHQIITIYPFKRRAKNSLWEIYLSSNLIDIHKQDVITELNKIIKK